MSTQHDYKPDLDRAKLNRTRAEALFVALGVLFLVVVTVMALAGFMGVTLW